MIWQDGRYRPMPMSGVAPSRASAVLEAAFTEFNLGLPKGKQLGGSAPAERAIGDSARLAATVIGAQAFEDGNHRVGLLTLAAALHAHHLPVPEFSDKVRWHLAIGAACRTNAQDMTPLLDLIAESVGVDPDSGYDDGDGTSLT